MATKLDLANAQLLGYYHAKRGYSILSLINSMGLTKGEWEKIKKYELDYMNRIDIEEIDDYFEHTK